MKSAHTLFAVLIATLIPVLSFAQAPPIEWQNTIGGTKSDLLYAIRQTTNGGYILGGSSNSGPTGDKTEGSYGMFEYWVCKLDQNGNVVWDNTIGGSNLDYLTCLQQTKDGGYILGGESKSNISGNKSHNCYGLYDYWVVKLDGNGNVVWDKTLGGSLDDYLYCIQQTSDNGYIVGGYSESNISGTKTENSRGKNDCYVVKLDSNGNIMWDKTIGGSNTDYLYSLVQTSDGGYMLGACSSSNISGEKSEKTKGVMDYWVVKLDQYGSVLWDKTIGGSKKDFCMDIKKVNGGGFILGGYSESAVSGDKTGSCRGEWDYWAVKIDANGNVLWDKTIGGSKEDEMFALDQTQDGGFVLAGYSESNISGDKTQNCLGYYDYWVVKLDQNGALQWDKNLGGNMDDEAYSVDATNDGGFIVAGHSSTNISGDKTEANQGALDWWVIKFATSSPQRTAQSPIESDPAILKADLYPNPTTGALTISVGEPLTEDATVMVNNMAGETVYSQQFSAADLESAQTIYLRKELTAGMYFVKIISGNRKFSKQIILQR